MNDISRCYISKNKIKKLLQKYLPYIIVGEIIKYYDEPDFYTKLIIFLEKLEKTFTSNLEQKIMISTLIDKIIELNVVEELIQIQPEMIDVA